MVTPPSGSFHGGGAHHEAGMLAQPCGDCAMDAVWVDRAGRVVGVLLVAVFIPDSDAKWCCHCGVPFYVSLSARSICQRLAGVNFTRCTEY
jgi:hypothetical protein